MKAVGGWANRTHCKSDHEFTPENTRWDRKRHHRICRACCKAKSAAYQERERLRLEAKGIRIRGRKASPKNPSIPNDYKPLGGDETNEPS